MGDTRKATASIALISIALALGALSSCSRGLAGLQYREEPLDAAAAIDGAGGLLDHAAELERRTEYRQGMGSLESGVMEAAGMHSGAVFAAWKELSYAYGRGFVDEGEIRARLGDLEARYEGSEGGAPAGALGSISAIRSFIDGDWKAADAALAELSYASEKPDSFRAWMRLAAVAGYRALAAAERDEYSMMQARYASFPEYWYRSALMESNAELRRDSAERCIVTSGGGPFSSPSRIIIAESFGLGSKAALSLLIRPEIEALAASAVDDPDALADMLPLLGLADNPSTLYAVGVLKSLCSIEKILSWLEAKASASSGRIAERLRYITGR